MRLLLALVVAVLLLRAAAESTEQGVAARVNGVAISTQAVRALADRMAGSTGAKSNRFKEDALDQLITLELLGQEARGEGLSVSKAEVDQEVKDLITASGGQPLQKALGGASASEFRNEVMRSLLIEKLLKKRISVQVSDKEVERYYKENQSLFERPRMVRASHIFFRSDGEGDLAARKRADQALARLKQGADFATVAKQLSQDSTTAPRGGDLGFFALGPTPLAEAAFKLQAGQTSDIVRDPQGLHIVRVVEDRPPGVAPFSDVSAEIRGMLEDEQREDKEDELIATLRAKATIQFPATEVNPKASDRNPNPTVGAGKK